MSVENDKNELIVNLTILSQVEKNRKLLTKDTYLNMEQKTQLLQVPEAVRRWWRGDNRDNTLKKIDLIINKAIDLIDNDVMEYLRKSIKGIENLKETYTDDTQTRARLDVVIDRINNAIKKFTDSNNKNDDDQF
jgi:hypothetical protein